MSKIIFVIAFLCSLQAAASTSTSEITDMWWNPSEPGWGVNIVLQRDVGFMTLFVYAQNRVPAWYTSDIHYQGGSVWTGSLYETGGPWFGGPFPENSTTSRQAGTVRFTLTALNQATLTYSVDGVSITKMLQRQTWTNENYTGAYAGGYSIRLSGCQPSSLNGLQETVGLLNVSHSGQSVALSAVTTVANCSFSGTYVQAGKLGQVQGSYSCVDGTRGTFTASEMTPTTSGFTAKVSGANQYCQWSGYLGGIARAQ